MKFFRWLFSIPDHERLHTKYLCIDDGDGYIKVATISVSRQTLEKMLKTFDSTDTLIFRAKED